MMLQVINVTFLVFNVMHGVVKVCDGKDTSSLVLGTFRGQILPEYILSNSRYVYVSFETQSTWTDGEFLVRYIATSPGIHMHSHMHTA